MQVDSLIFAPWMITVDESVSVLSHHVLAIKNQQIVAIEPENRAGHFVALQEYHLDSHILMPGLVNLHGHSAMTLLRGMADDLALMDWLNNHIWPAENKHTSLPFVYDGTLLAMAEMLRGGTTTINDMYFYHASVAKAALRMNMRTFVGCTILDFPTNFAQNAEEYLAHALNTKVAFYGDHLVQFALAPHAPYTVSDETFKKVVTAAEKNEMLLHCHIHETAAEVAGSLKEHGMRPLARLEQLGVLQNRLIAAHMVHVNDEELALSAKYGVNVAHNPASNMKLASGFAPVQKMLDAGINVGLGTDGAASNNKLDMISDMRLSALIAKGFSGSPTDIPAAEAIKMATINGAKALGMGDKIGSLEVGKLADMIAIDVSAPELQPMFDPISHVVYAASRENVTHTWVNGRNVLKDRQFTQFDLNGLLETVKMWQGKIASSKRR